MGKFEKAFAVSGLSGASLSVQCRRDKRCFSSAAAAVTGVPAVRQTPTHVSDRDGVAVPSLRKRVSFKRMIPTRKAVCRMTSIELRKSVRASASLRVRDRDVWDAYMYRAAVLRGFGKRSQRMKARDAALILHAFASSGRRNVSFFSYMIDDLVERVHSLNLRDAALLCSSLSRFARPTRVGEGKQQGDLRGKGKGLREIETRRSKLLEAVFPVLLRKVSAKVPEQDLALLAYCYLKLDPCLRVEKGEEGWHAVVQKKRNAARRLLLFERIGSAVGARLGAKRVEQPQTFALLLQAYAMSSLATVCGRVVSLPGHEAAPLFCATTEESGRERVLEEGSMATASVGDDLTDAPASFPHSAFLFELMEETLRRLREFKGMDFVGVVRAMSLVMFAEDLRAREEGLGETGGKSVVSDSELSDDEEGGEGQKRRQAPSPSSSSAIPPNFPRRLLASVVENAPRFRSRELAVLLECLISPLHAVAAGETTGNLSELGVLSLRGREWVWDAGNKGGCVWLNGPGGRGGAFSPEISATVRALLQESLFRSSALPSALCARYLEMLVQFDSLHTLVWRRLSLSRDPNGSGDMREEGSPFGDRGSGDLEVENDGLSELVPGVLPFVERVRLLSDLSLRLIYASDRDVEPSRGRGNSGSTTGELSWRDETQMLSVASLAVASAHHMLMPPRSSRGTLTNSHRSNESSSTMSSESPHVGSSDHHDCMLLHPLLMFPSLRAVVGFCFERVSKRRDQAAMLLNEWLPVLAAGGVRDTRTVLLAGSQQAVEKFPLLSATELSRCALSAAVLQLPAVVDRLSIFPLLADAPFLESPESRKSSAGRQRAAEAAVNALFAAGVFMVSSPPRALSTGLLVKAADIACADAHRLSPPLLSRLAFAWHAGALAGASEKSKQTAEGLFESLVGSDKHGTVLHSARGATENMKSKPAGSTESRDGDSKRGLPTLPAVWRVSSNDCAALLTEPVSVPQGMAAEVGAAGRERARAKSRPSPLEPPQVSASWVRQWDPSVSEGVWGLQRKRLAEGGGVPGGPTFESRVEEELGRWEGVGWSTNAPVRAILGLGDGLGGGSDWFGPGSGSCGHVGMPFAVELTSLAAFVDRQLGGGRGGEGMGEEREKGERDRQNQALLKALKSQTRKGFFASRLGGSAPSIQPSEALQDVIGDQRVEQGNDMRVSPQTHILIDLLYSDFDFFLQPPAQRRRSSQASADMPTSPEASSSSRGIFQPSKLCGLKRAEHSLLRKAGWLLVAVSEEEWRQAEAEDLQATAEAASNRGLFSSEERGVNAEGGTSGPLLKQLPNGGLSARASCILDKIASLQEKR